MRHVAAAALFALGGCSTPRTVEQPELPPLPKTPERFVGILRPLPGHVAYRIGSWAPWTTEFSSTPPQSITELPEHSDTALFGEFSFGDGTRYKNPAVMVGFMLDEERERFFIDSNRNGSLRDEHPATWVVERRPVRDGKETAGTVTVRAPVATSAAPTANSWNVALFFTEKGTREQFNIEFSLDRYRDYGPEGFIALGGKTYRILLDDGAVTGDFSSSPKASREDITLLIDVNDNGLYEHRGEEFEISQWCHPTPPCFKFLKSDPAKGSKRLRNCPGGLVAF